MIHLEHPHDASLPPQNPREALKPTYRLPETSQDTPRSGKHRAPGPQFYACENRPLPTFPAPKFPASADRTRHEGKYPPMRAERRKKGMARGRGELNMPN